MGLSSGCSVGFQKVFRPLGIHLMRLGHELRYVSRVFEDDHVMGIEAYGSMVFSSMKQILSDVHDIGVSMVTLLRKQRSYSLIRFVHEIVQNYQVFISGVEGVQFRQSLLKVHSIFGSV